MLPTEPLALNHSWPIAERASRFDLGVVHDSLKVPGGMPGLWRCEFPTDRLIWSDAVYDLFGLPRGALITRQDAVRLYAEHSRAAMERLRNHALKHHRGFTLDVELRPVNGGVRWMRLVAAPFFRGGTLTALEGLKFDVSALYR